MLQSASCHLPSSVNRDGHTKVMAACLYAVVKAQDGSAGHGVILEASGTETANR